ncbi:hypothetical protein HX071_18180 [Myroides marinus]|uniref:hypothetical protein n=1 Tax=Myroides marinus TaxID=703342 RepID=UPI000741E793|nr:hypothetical protein [Myroides marinus]KUF45178.1 hypothetical protein AS361_15255 [Myroides marinus]MDM1504099.1 hypothetical protein [Myroides marinus]
MTAQELNSIAEQALEQQYNDLISNLRECAKQGKNSYLSEELPDILLDKLIFKGYRITPVVRYRYSFLFQKKRVKHYKIQF